MSKSFDEGGAKGLLLHSLGVGPHGCNIVFDCSCDDVETLYHISRRLQQNRSFKSIWRNDGHRKSHSQIWTNARKSKRWVLSTCSTTWKFVTWLQRIRSFRVYRWWYNHSIYSSIQKIHSINKVSVVLVLIIPRISDPIASHDYKKRFFCE